MMKTAYYHVRGGDFYVEPRMLNHLNILHGGELVRQCDSTIGLLASQYAQGRVLTVAIKQLDFSKVTHVQDHIDFCMTLIKTSTHTMMFHVTVELLRFDQPPEQIGEGCFIFIAVDDQLHPRPVPAYHPADEIRPELTRLAERYRL